MLYDGRVHRPIDLERVGASVDRAVAQGIEAFAVCLIHSYANSSHEEAVGRLLAERYPAVAVTLSSELVREVGEVKRVSTAVANAYVQPLARRYLRRLAGALEGAEGDARGPRLYLMVSSGGTTSACTAEDYPITLVESGPAAGALAAAFYSRLTGIRHVISFDMGGTTAKACLVDDGRPDTASEFEAAREERFKRGSGIPLKVPVIDLIEVGAGGGSIARVDSIGLLKVGPDSAGADPGPACYGKGGEWPTVTDANLVLGYLAPDYFLGGEMRLDRAAAERAIQAHVAGPLGISVEQAAWGIHEVVNEYMAGAARTHVAEKNRDPRRYALVAFGGAGPAHACSVAQKVRASRVLVPVAAGATSALGLLVAPPAFEFVHSHVGTLGEIDWAEVNRVFADLDERGRGTMAQAGVPAGQVRFERAVDMRYVGQAHRIRVALPWAAFGLHSAADLAERFCREYQRLYSLLNPEYPIEALSWRVRAIGPDQQVNLRSAAGTVAGKPARKGARPAYFAEARGYLDCPVYDHARLAPGATLEGPAIVEQRESTTVVPPGKRMQVDEWLNLLMS